MKQKQFTVYYTFKDGTGNQFYDWGSHKAVRDRFVKAILGDDTMKMALLVVTSNGEQVAFFKLNPDTEKMEEQE